MMARITVRQLLDHAAEHGYGVPAASIRGSNPWRRRSDNLSINVVRGNPNIRRSP
jgi:hypothetical protein